MLPIDIGSAVITIGKKQVKGNNIGFYMVYPNPLNNRKYVAVIGYNQEISLGSLDFGNAAYESPGLFSEKDITSYGFYDYKAWDNSGSYSPILLKGFFDNKWE